MSRRPFIAVYILTNQPRGTLYIGMSSNLPLRYAQHLAGVFEGFTKRYGLKRLVWFEQHGTVIAAIAQERRLKKYKRDWKINLIERENPLWVDLGDRVRA